MRKLPSFEFNNSPDDVNDKTLWMKMILPSNTHAADIKKRIKPKNPIREFIFLKLVLRFRFHFHL